MGISWSNPADWRPASSGASTWTAASVAVGRASAAASSTTGTELEPGWNSGTWARIPGGKPDSSRRVPARWLDAASTVIILPPAGTETQSESIGPRKAMRVVRAVAGGATSTR